MIKAVTTTIAIFSATACAKVPKDQGVNAVQIEHHNPILGNLLTDAEDGGIICDAGATNIFTDPNNCGGCGFVCAKYTPGAVSQVGAGPCVSGICPPNGQFLCTPQLGCCYTPQSPALYGNVLCGQTAFCINILQDSANCGGCGNKCSPGLSCVNGSCS
jgi:hypothetical protein